MSGAYLSKRKRNDHSINFYAVTNFGILRKSVRTKSKSSSALSLTVVVDLAKKPQNTQTCSEVPNMNMPTGFGENPFRPNNSRILSSVNKRLLMQKSKTQAWTYCCLTLLNPLSLTIYSMTFSAIVWRNASCLWLTTAPLTDASP